MSSNPTLGFVIRAFNQTGGAFRQIRESVTGLTSGARQAESSFGGVAGQASGIAQEVFRANVATQAFNFGISKIQQGYGFLQGKIQQATNLQLELVSATNNLKSVAEVSYGEAKGEMEELNNQLAMAAASLPGVTQDYKTLGQTISDNVVEAYKDANGNVDLEQWRETTKQISSSFGAITASSTKDIGNTMLALNQAMGGASTQQLKQLGLFEQNANLANELEAQLKERGVSSLGDLGMKQRIELIRDIGNKFIDEDFKKHASETVEGLTQGFMSAIFDPSSGLFGMMRDLEEGIEGTQSLFSSYNEALKTLIGEDSILTEFTKVVENLGLTFDPMSALKVILDYVNSRLELVREFLEEISDTSDRVIVFQEVLKSLLGKAIPYVINQISYFAIGLMDKTSLFVEDVLSAFASPSASAILATLKDATSTLLGNIDFAAVATAFTGLLTAGLLLVGGKVIAGTLAASIFGAIKLAIIGPISSALLGIGAALTGLLGGLIVPLGIIAAIVGGAVFLLSQDQTQIRSAFDALRSRLEEFLGFALDIESVAGAISDFVGSLGTRLLGAVDRLIESVDFSAIGNNAGDAVETLGSGLSGAMEVFGKVIQTAILSIDISEIFSRITEVAPKLVRAFGTAISTAVPTFLNLALRAINVASGILFSATLRVVQFAVLGLFAIPWGAIFISAGEIILTTLKDLDWGKFAKALFNVLVVGAVGLGAKAIAGLAVAKFTALYRRVLLVPLQNFMLNSVLPKITSLIAGAKAKVLGAAAKMFAALGTFFTQTVLPNMLAMLASAKATILATTKAVFTAMIPLLPVIAIFLAGVAAIALVFKLFGGDFKKLSLLFNMSAAEWKAAFLAWIGAIGDGISSLVDNFLEWLGGIRDWFVKGWEDLKTGIAETFIAVLENIVPTPIQEALELGFSGIAEKIKAALARLNPFSDPEELEPPTPRRRSGGSGAGRSYEREIDVSSTSAAVDAAVAQATAAANAYRGFVPTAQQGWVRSLITAGNQERRNMPGNAELVVANSSETILRPEQFRSMMSGLTRPRQDQKPASPVVPVVPEMTRPQITPPVSPVASKVMRPQIAPPVSPVASKVMRPQPTAIASPPPRMSDLARQPQTQSQGQSKASIGTVNVTISVPATNTTTSPEFVDEMLRQINLRLQQYQAGQLN